GDLGVAPPGGAPFCHLVERRGSTHGSAARGPAARPLCPEAAVHLQRRGDPGSRPDSRSTRFGRRTEGPHLRDDLRIARGHRHARAGGRRHGRGPRLHDLRHRFAVCTLLRWYRSGIDVERELPKLATYLGHVHVNETYWYLEAVPELLELAARRLDSPKEVET